MHDRLHPGADRLKAGQPQQVERCGSQCGYRPGAITSVAVSVFMELGVTDPVPALNAPAISYQLQQGFWGGAQAREKQMSGTEGLAVTGTGGRQLHDPAGSAPGFTDVRWCLFCPQRPADAASVADLVIACHERDVTLSLKLAADLAMQRLLVAFYRQQEVGSLLLELLKNGF